VRVPESTIDNAVWATGEEDKQTLYGLGKFCGFSLGHMEKWESYFSYKSHNDAGYKKLMDNLQILIQAKIEKNDRWITIMQDRLEIPCIKVKYSNNIKSEGPEKIFVNGSYLKVREAND